MWDNAFQNYLLLLMVFMRMAGMLLTNPLLGQRTVPVRIKMGLALCFSLLVTPTLNTAVEYENTLIYLFALLKEFFVGFSISFIMQMFLSALQIAGDLIDLQLGVGMSRIYDPQTNISMPISGTIFHIMYVLLFFAANGHLTLIRIVAASYELLPPGLAFLRVDALDQVVFLFGNILVLGVKLALPVLAIELLTEVGLGVLMRTVPQINVFVVGLQLKLLLGLLVIVLILPNVAGLFDSATNTMFESIGQMLRAMGT